MADAFEDWKHRWFGYWQDDLPNDLVFPFIASFVDNTLAMNNSDKIYEYLCGAKPLILNYGKTECLFPNCPYKMVDIRGAWLTKSPVTDGVWIWSKDLYHYVRYHSVRIPNSMYEHLKQKDFELPRSLDFNNTLFQSLDWPFIPAPIQRRMARECSG